MDAARIKSREGGAVWDINVRLPSECPADRIALAADAAMRAFADWKYEDPIRASRITTERGPYVRVIPFGLMVTITFGLEPGEER